MPRLWEQILGESETAFRAFEFYMNSGPPRIHPDYAAFSIGAKPQEGVAWYTQYQWLHRATAYDEICEKSRRETYESWAAETNQISEVKDLVILGTAREVVATELTKILRQSKKASHPLMSAREIATIMKHTIELTRLVRGQTTFGAGADGVDFTDHLGDDELREMDRMLRKGKGAQ